MSLQVVGGTVSAAYAFDPAEGAVDFNIPAVSSVMGSLSRGQLAEPNHAAADAHLMQEQHGPGQVVGEGLVGDDP